MSEELGFEQRFRYRRAIHLDKRHFALRAVVVNGARDHLLARARLAHDEHGAPRFGDDFGGPDDLFHPAATADQPVVIELGVALADEIPVLGAQPLMIERPAGDDEQFVDFEGLLQVVERPELHRFDGALDGRVRGHHDDLRPLGRAGGVQLTDKIQPRQLGHEVVDDQQVEHALREQPLRFARARGRMDFVPVLAQRLGQRVEDLRFVVYEED